MACEPAGAARRVTVGEDRGLWLLPGVTFTGSCRKTCKFSMHARSLCLCCSKNRHTRKYFTHRRPPLHEYSYATVMSCDMLSWQGPGTTWPGCWRKRKAVSERVTQACLIQLDPTTMVGFLNLRWVPDVPPPFPLLFEFKRGTPVLVEAVG